MFKKVLLFFKNLFAVRLGSPSDYLIALVGGLFIGYLPGKIVEYLIENYPTETPLGLEVVDGVLRGPHDYAFYIMILSVCLIGPIIEELIFRGALWRLLEKLFNPIIVLAFSSVLFALAHVDPIHIIGVFPIGVFIGWLRYRSDSIFPSILAHIINNTAVCLSVVAF